MERESQGLKLIKVVNGSVQAKTYTFASFTLIVVMVLLIGAIRPTMIKISEIQKEVEAKQVTNKKLDDKIEALSTLSNEYADNKDMFTKLPLVFPSQGNFSLLLSNIDEIAREQGFNLNNINFGQSDKVKLTYNALKPWNVRFSISGSRANLIPFLSKMESLPMFPTITKVSYSLDKEKLGIITFSIEMVIYKLEDQNFYL